MVFTKVKLIVGGAVVLFAGLAVWAGYTYVTNLQDKVVHQAGEISKLETANETLTSEREQLKTDLEENKINQETLNEELRVARESKEALIKLFADHDFAKLVQRKPGLIENRINKGTDKVFTDLENISDE